LELPYAAIGLIWNSIMSVAGAWFTLMACEMFHFGSQDFRLPGLGSYLQTAADLNNGRAITWGLVTMIAIIVAIDQLVWRPLITWSDKFKFEQVESSKRISSPILHLLTSSKSISALLRHTTTPLNEAIYIKLASWRRQRLARATTHPQPQVRGAGRAFVWMLIAIGAVAVLYAAHHAIELIRPVTGAQYMRLLEGAVATFLRVNFALALAAAWTIPVGVAIASRPRMARIAQPLAQIAASVPATALFPVILLALLKLGGGMGIGSIALMLLGTQWYILFNVIAGALAIPTDLKEVATLFRFSKVERWKTVILPGIFPFLITGMVTASGGAWNASIFAEYFTLKGRTMTTLGLGEQINAATADGQFPIILLGTVLISLMVVTTNRLLWRRLYRLAETRYRLDG
jgi:NitT/TauT family transport system permease protein